MSWQRLGEFWTFSNKRQEIKPIDLHRRPCDHLRLHVTPFRVTTIYGLGSFCRILLTMTTTLSPQRTVTATKENRPPSNTRHPTAPSVMTVNGHFANVGEKPTKEQYEHGVQIINQDQEFKYGFPHMSSPLWLF